MNRFAELREEWVFQVQVWGWAILGEYDRTAQVAEIREDDNWEPAGHEWDRTASHLLSTTVFTEDGTCEEAPAWMALPHVALHIAKGGRRGT